jgi:hypothetical protein
MTSNLPSSAVRQPEPCGSGSPSAAFSLPRWQTFAEVALIFAVFFVYGAYPAPDVNEPYYLGKAIHFWNPDWIRGDFFLDSPDTHQVFYCAIGWLSLWLPPAALAWVVRVATWLLLAWGWQRLSFAAVPRRWFSILTAALFVALLKHFHMAGEWVVGGAEAKGFSYALVFFGMAALLHDRWNRAWLLLGAAAAMHVLVGGWACVAAGVAWLAGGPTFLPGLRKVGRNPCSPYHMLPGLTGGFLLSLLGLLPALRLNWGTNSAVVHEANQIYVFERFFHHLSPGDFPEVFIARFALLCGLWLVLCEIMPSEMPLRQLRAFVFGAVAIALVGVAISFLPTFDPALAAGLLRFYWFRLADVAVPLGVALMGAATVAATLELRPLVGKRWLAGITAVAAVLVVVEAADRARPQPPRAAPLSHYWEWQDACGWVAASGKIPRDARFLTPRWAQTFKWYAGRSDIVNWKEAPQDAVAVVEWWRRMGEIHGTGSDDPRTQWYATLAELGAPRLQELGAKYRAAYAITEARPRLPLEVVYENEAYIIYRLSP